MAACALAPAVFVVADAVARGRDRDAEPGDCHGMDPPWARHRAPPVGFSREAVEPDERRSSGLVPSPEHEVLADHVDAGEERDVQAAKLDVAVQPGFEQVY